MIRIIDKLPDKLVVACSGGPDSMAALDFLKHGRREVSAAYFNHGTSYSKDAEHIVTDYCRSRKIHCVVGNISRDKYNHESQEEYWRNERYRFFETLDNPIVTAHHLDDVVEWWIFSSIHGNPRLIPYQNGKIIRPFLMTPKSELTSWCERKNVPSIQDISNKNVRFSRNRIRHNIIPEIEKINPGIRKNIKKLVESSFNRNKMKESAL